MISICLPSRGLVFTRTMQSVFDGMKILKENGIKTTLHTSHDLPIPKSHNGVVEEALKEKPDKVFLMEEDNFLFPKAFLALATSDFDVVTIQYNDKNGSPHGIIHYNEAGEVLWGGLGSTVVKSEVFKKLGKPYFRTDTRYKNIKKRKIDKGYVTEYERIENRKVWDEEKGEMVEKKDPYKYGGLDIDFYTRVRQNKFTIGVVKEHKGHHFELVKLGEKHTNNGCHVIRQV